MAERAFQRGDTFSYRVSPQEARIEIDLRRWMSPDIPVMRHCLRRPGIDIQVTLVNTEGRTFTRSRRALHDFAERNKLSLPKNALEAFQLAILEYSQSQEEVVLDHAVITSPRKQN